MKLITLFVVIFILNGSVNSQVNLKLKEGKSAPLNLLKLHERPSKAQLPVFIYAGIAFFLINPEIVIENKKAYFGLTKEISTGYYPYGRIAFEYTHIFRSYSQNHLRLSYNLDYFIPTQFFVALMFSGGVGYFTDTKHNGIFPQASFGICIPLPIAGTMITAVYPYLRARHTFVKGDENSNITDISLGMGLILWY
jgi:hypothetical protein